MRSYQTPYVTFSREEWLNFRRDTPMTLTAEDLAILKDVQEARALKEITDIYLPLSQLLSFYVTASQHIHADTQAFLGSAEPKVPYIIGIAGSVAVGKSATSRILTALLSRWTNHSSVQYITTDGFLYPNAYLTQKGLMEKKGFPESYDLGAFLQFMTEVKSGKASVKAPVYSHQSYDIVPQAFIEIKKPDILIVEGLNILQTGKIKVDQPPIFISDFFDFSIFVDANVADIKKWYVDRVVKFSQTTFRDTASFFHSISKMDEAEIRAFASDVWEKINGINLINNILPCRDRAQLILKKGSDHAITEVKLRKV